MSCREEYTVTSRAFLSDSVTAVDEPYTVDASKIFTLQNLNAITVTISVKNADVLTHPLPYAENTDYRITVVGAQTEISANIANSQIKVGDKLLITYTYQVAPQIRFATNTRGANSNLSLFSSKYRIFASWQETSQSLLEGRSAGVNLVGQTSYMLCVGRVFRKG